MLTFEGRRELKQKINEHVRERIRRDKGNACIGCGQALDVYTKGCISCKRRRLARAKREREKGEDR